VAGLDRTRSLDVAAPTRPRLCSASSWASLGALLPWVTAARFSGEVAVGALRDSAVLASVGPVAAWALLTRRIAGREGLERLRRALPEFAEVVRPGAALDAGGG
jgi:hypothetical protein